MEQKFMENKPIIAHPKSIKIEVEAGKRYFWCSCGASKNQPFCDGSHKGSGFTPVEYIADENKLVGFCGCKYTKISPLCDGTHRELKIES
jgi:CDGSH-type Zn-finger protein